MPPPPWRPRGCPGFSPLSLGEDSSRKASDSSGPVMKSVTEAAYSEKWGFIIETSFLLRINTIIPELIMHISSKKAYFQESI